MSSSESKKRKRPKDGFTADNADRHLLYELSVQDTEHEVKFVSRTFRKLTGRRAVHLREDFCGTAALCARWVRGKRDRTATGVDLDAEVLEYGRRYHIEPLGDAASRVTLRHSNVLAPPSRCFDVVVAFNYSYFVFRTRRQMAEYFRSVHRTLADDGVLMLDAYGGYEAHQVLVEKRKHDGFTYVWEQAVVNPVDNHVINHIHFKFPDKTRLSRAFTYDWRLWQLVELRELLEECGFAQTHVYWEQDDDDGEGNGVFRKALVADADAGWNAYVMALKSPAL